MTAAFLFAHGAGAGSQSAWMQGWTARLSTLGPTRAFDYPYMAAGRRLPDKLPALLAAHQVELAAFRAELPAGTPVVLVGKSMGSRVGCHLALTATVPGVICLGFPLVGASKKKPVRRDVLEQLRCPVLFVQGTRDKMGPLALFDEVRAVMSAPSDLHVVSTGDHSLLVTKTWQRQQARTQEQVDQAILARIATFVAELL